jgi:2-polyprenyl-3-methyl-5-hydroxy-6-metoxy-1,4-benzoquinol methylase
MISKTERVKSLFEVPEKYLSPRQYDIQIRVETVQQFTRAKTFENVLDIGCGNGAISLPLLPRTQKLTLLDLSKNMLELAGGRVPVDRADDVRFINDDFLKADLKPNSFDLILCVGVLAHVDSIGNVIERVSELARPGASVVLEFTDSFHFWGAPVVLYQKMLKLLRPEPYALNRLKRRQIVDLFRANGFSESALFRYGLPPIGTSKFKGQEEMYRLVRQMFGSTEQNRNRWMGNQFIYFLRKA